MILKRRPNLPAASSSVVTIGNFDGIHLGHQALIDKTLSLAKAQGIQSCVLTFEPYPKAFFHPDRKVARLTTLREKVFLLKTFGIDIVYLLPFNQKLSLFTPTEFIEKILGEQLQAKQVIVGEDFRFGYQRQGNVDSLKQISSFETIVMPAITHHQIKVSSTVVRESLQQGNLNTAAQWLGRDYFMMGRVVKGQRRGHQLGFPTANISLKNRVSPLQGVFAVKVYDIDDQAVFGIANIGNRPTVDGKQFFLEVHLFDFSRDIYHQFIRVAFLQKIRDEMRFDSLDALKAQIAQDVDVAKQFLRDD